MFDIPDPTGRRGSLHDQVFKDLIGRFLPDFLTLVAPEPARRLDLSRWTLLDKETFTDWPRGRRRELDLLAKMTFAGSGRTALVHVEIESRFRREVGPRLGGYYMQIRLRHGLPVLPILVCLRRGRPGVHRETVADAEFGPETNLFSYYSFCLAGSRAEDFLAKDQPLAWALAALMRPETLSRAEHKMACLRRIAAAGLDELHGFLLFNCVETYLQLTGRDAEELDALQARGKAEEVRVMRMTWAEQLKQEGRVMGVEMGKREGLETGLEMGREQGARQTLLRLLGARFGPLSDEVKRRVEAIRSVERLNQIAEQILVARSLEEMGLR